MSLDWPPFLFTLFSQLDVLFCDPPLVKWHIRRLLRLRLRFRLRLLILAPLVDPPIPKGRLKRPPPGNGRRHVGAHRPRVARAAWARLPAAVGRPPPLRHLHREPPEHLLLPQVLLRQRPLAGVQVQGPEAEVARVPVPPRRHPHAVVAGRAAAAGRRRRGRR